MNRLVAMSMVFLIVLVVFLACNGLQTYTIRGSAPGPTTLVIASTHGNEPAGFFALQELLASGLHVQRGTVVLVPSVNTCGRCTNRRHAFGDFDINRNYPDKTYLNGQVSRLVARADWVIDLHEGWGFRKLDARSVGSGVYPGSSKQAASLANHIIDGINASIDVPHKRFSTGAIPKVVGSLRDLCNEKKKHYLLVETSGINDIQPMAVRKQQHMYIVAKALEGINGA